MDQQGQENSTFESLIKDMVDKLIRIPATQPVPEDDPPACLISWVDNQIRAEDPGEYKPRRVRVGPFHRDTSHWMEQEKEDLLRSALSIDVEQRREQVGRYLAAMDRLEGRARRCYNRTFSKMAREEFACMLLLDGYFVLSCFVPITGGTSSGAGESGSRVADGGYDCDVVFLLENQVPFFILEVIYKLVVTEAEHKDSFVMENVARHIEALVHRHGYVHSTVTFNLADPRPCHLLHLLYMYFRPTILDQHRRRSVNAQPNGDKATIVAPIRWRAATYYYAAGVRLARRELDGDEARSVLDVELRDGTLYIPCLKIDANTLTMLRNMVALEQHSPAIGSHVAAYCHFMSQVASTEEDVKLLSDKGIVVHLLSADSDVADGFGDLCRGVVLNVDSPDFNYLRPIQGKLEELCRRPGAAGGSPWRGCGTISAATT